MKSIRHMLKYTNINNISRNMCGYSCTRKWRARDCGADTKHFSQQYVRLNSHGSVATIIHVASRSHPRRRFFRPFSRRSFSAMFLRSVAWLIGKDCVSLGWPTPRRRSRARFIIVTLHEVLLREGKILSPSLRRFLPQ